MLAEMETGSQACDFAILSPAQASRDLEDVMPKRSFANDMPEHILLWLIRHSLRAIFLSFPRNFSVMVSLRFALDRLESERIVFFIGGVTDGS